MHFQPLQNLFCILCFSLTSIFVLTASFGGLLSLLLGFTLIAGFDLIIFFFFGVVYSSVASSNNEKGKNEPANQIKNIKGSKGNKIYVQEFRSNFNDKVVNGKF